MSGLSRLRSCCAHDVGAPVLIHSVLCGGCGRHFLDLRGKHALCCMGSATTTGHNRVRDTNTMGLAMADAGTVTEPLELVPSAPNLRPADIFDAGEHGGLPRLRHVVLGLTLWNPCESESRSTMVKVC